MFSFSSLEFIFRFLPIFLVAYFVVPSKYREVVLLLGSIIFYAIGEPIFIVVLLVTMLLNYLLARQSLKQGDGRFVNAWQQKSRRNYLIGAVVLDVIVLVVFKALAVFVNSALLPIGISFYIFKMISFQVDVYRNEILVKPKFYYVALYFTLFPQVVSGPIMRYNEGEFDLERTCGWESFEEGITYFIAGLGMKVLLADRLSILWNDLQMIGFQSISTPLAWFGAVGYSLQLYFDFWGYSLMAAGIMVMLGYNFIENFNHPYASRTIGEFYRRWHVTLGSWFRDYVYIPMGGSRCSKPRMIFNLALVWLLTGIWHGSGFNYVIWGVVLGLFIICEKLFYGKNISKVPVLGNLYLIVVITMTWVVFAITDLKQLGTYFSRLFPIFGEGVAVHTQDIFKYGQSYGIFFLIGIVLCIPGVFQFFDKHKKNPIIIFLLVIVFWYSVYMMSCSAGNPFMYLNF